MSSPTYTLLDSRRRPYQSTVKGLFGGNRSDHVYGRLNCPAALAALGRGGYRANRVFFADEATAVAAGYRPCAACLPERYAEWKVLRDATASATPSSNPASSTLARPQPSRAAP